MAVRAPPRGTRPRNRRELIVAAAAELFARDGYPHVGMSDIAAAVAIGPSALYRHFTGKRELLAEVVRDAFGTIRATLAGLDDPEEVPGSLARSMLDRRGLGVLWQREARHLEPAAREPLRADLGAVAGYVTELAHRRRPELDATGADLLAWAVLGALMSVSYHRVQLPRAEYLGLLGELADAVLGTGLPASGTSRTAAASPAKSTRDALLAAAVRLFAERGYHGVSIDDVAAEAGIAGPSIYHHFPTKAGLLAAPMADGADHLHATVANTVDEDPRSALHLLLRSYVDNSLDNHHVIDLLISEIRQLPEPDQLHFRRVQREYIAAWVDRLCAARPDMPAAHARVRVQAALTVTNDVARTPHLRKLRGVDTAIGAIGASIMDLPAW